MDQLPSDHFITSLQFTKTLFKDVYPAVDPGNPGLSVAGRLVIVTGASRGIGAKGIVPAFAKAGATGIVLVATNAEKLKATEQSLIETYANVQTLTVVCDISNEGSVGNLFAEVKTKFGRAADILVNNAGVNVGDLNIHEEDAKQWWYNFEVNAKGAFLLAQHFIKSLPSPETPATIVNLVSAGAWQVYPTISGYCISKLAVVQLMSHIAAAYPNITAVGLHPGMLETDMLMPVFARFDLNSPELIGGLCVWLCGRERAGFLSGRVVMANWDVDELVARKEEIGGGKTLQMDLVGNFGKEFF